MENYKTLLSLAGVYALMYAFNCMMPLCYGDDYLYSFVWTGEQGFFEPLPASARRISSWSDVFDSLYNHYLTHAGRTVIFLPIFFFLWQGKQFFDVFNTFLAVLLIMEICWISNRGVITLDVKPSRVNFVFFVLWTFTLGFPIVFLWLTGACNYLWPATLLLAFLIPYVRQWFSETPLSINPFIMLIAGVIAGWTNENTICWFIVVIAIMCWKLRAEGRLSAWQISGLIGLTIGYALLMLAPGNFVRLAEDSTMIPPDWWVQFSSKALTFFIVMVSQLFLWFYFRDTLRNAADFGDDVQIKRSLLMSKAFAAVSFASNLIMLAAPEFPMRSSFPSLIYLLIAATILIRLQHETGRNQMKAGAKKFLHLIGAIYFAVTSVATLYGGHLLFEHRDRINRLAETASENEILTVENFTLPKWLDAATTLHLAIIPLNRDENAWENVAFARYYHIKGIKAK